MVIFTGQSGLPTISMGKLHFCLNPPRILTAFSKLTPEEEIVRFRQAQLNCIHELSQLHKRAVERIGPQQAHVFMIYAMMVEDSVYVDMVHTYIKTQKMTAEYAVSMTGEYFTAAFSELEDEYMRARGEDVCNVCKHLVHNLISFRELRDTLDEPAILLDNEFSPGRILNMERDKVIALVAKRGSIYTHAAQMTRILGIPAAAQMDVPPIYEGHPAILDSFDGKLYVDPVPEVVREMTEKMNASSLRQPILA